MDLSLATFEELIEELQQRTGTFLLVCSHKEKPDCSGICFKANSLELFGLINCAKQQAREYFRTYLKKENF